MRRNGDPLCPSTDIVCPSCYCLDDSLVFASSMFRRNVTVTLLHQGYKSTSTPKAEQVIPIIDFVSGIVERGR